MENLIAKMRADWTIVAADRVARGEWTAEDEEDIGLAIKAAVTSGQRETIAMWARWLADLSAWVCARNLIVRGAEAGIRAAAAEERAKREAARPPGSPERVGR